MKRVTERLLVLMLLASAFRVELWAQDKGALHVTVTDIPEAIVLLRDVSGPYTQHPVVMREMMEYVGKHYAAVGACFGIYPRDPDATAEKELKWQVGVRVTTGEPQGFGKSIPTDELPKMSHAEREQIMRRMQQPAAPYRLAMLPGTTAGLVESTVADAAHDGLDVIPWMARNGYVQTGPTRMEYLSHEGEPSAIKVRIIVPMKLRATGLKSSN